MQLKRQWLPMDGCVDLQVNGYLGTDFSAPGLQLAQVRSMVEGLRDRGTIAFCPTVITSSLEVYERNLPVLAQAMEQEDLQQHLLGIHLEGPFISPRRGARGAHPARHTAMPDLDFFERLRELCRGRVALVTLAPELPGAMELIEHLVGLDITVSLGHHLADRNTIAEACDKGAKAATHLGNGIPNHLPRHPNPIWDQLDEERLTIMVIGDGHHVPDSFLRVVARLTGGRRLIIVSDSAPVAGLPAGAYHTLGQDVVLEESGLLWNPIEKHLVGSSYNLSQCLGHVGELGVLNEKELRQAAYDNPLALIGKPVSVDGSEAKADDL